MKYFTDYTNQLDKKDFRDYQTFKHAPVKKGLELSKQLKGLNVVHVNTAFNSGGVAEILKSQVPMENSLGINSSWLVLKGNSDFFGITKKIHNLLQGKAGSLTKQEQQLYLSYNKEAAAELVQFLATKTQPLVVILHDPQPLPMVEFLHNYPVISRIHIDLSRANKSIVTFLKPLLLQANHTIFTDKTFRPRFIQPTKSLLSFPAIDAFVEKNVKMDSAQVRHVLEKIGVDPNRPLATQVSRFDPWKDPWGVIKAYQMAKKKFPHLQLALAGLIVAEDDPEANGIYAQLQRDFGNDRDIHLYGEKTPPGNLSNDAFINALQTGSDIVIQKSLKEGFGLTVTEALFKGSPVIGGKVGGIKHQIQHGKNGFLVTSAAECAKYMIKILENPKLKEKLGKQARVTVEKKFLMPSLMLDHFRLYKKLMRKAKRQAIQKPADETSFNLSADLV